MQIPIDEAGRVVLPKEIRNRVGIRAGVKLEVIEEGNSIILKAVPQEPKLVSKGGVLVVVPEKSGGKIDTVTLIKKQREKRNKKFW